MIYCSILVHSKRLPPVLFGQVAAAVPRGKTAAFRKSRAFNNLVTVKTKEKTMCKTNVTCLYIYINVYVCLHVYEQTKKKIEKIGKLLGSRQLEPFRGAAAYTSWGVSMNLTGLC